MVEAVENQVGLEGYTLFYGEPIEGDTRLALSHLHGIGPEDDGRNSFPALVRFAAKNDFDMLLTPHNSGEGVEKALRYRDNNGYSGVAIPHAKEYAAIDKLTGRHTHIIVIGANYELPPGLSDEDANREAHRAGGITVAAHPDLGNYSVSIDRIRELSQQEDPEVKFDLVEEYNASVHNAEFYGQRLGCLGEKLGLPRYSLNQAATVFMREEGHALGLKSFVGSDAHGLKQADDVLIMHSANITLFDALKFGVANFYVKNNSNRVTPAQFVGIRMSNVAGKLMKEVPLFNALYHAR